MFRKPILPLIVIVPVVIVVLYEYKLVLGELVGIAVITPPV